MSSAPTSAPPRSLALHHLALGTAEVEGLASFYREIFGLEEVSRQLDTDGGLRSIWLELGGALLMIERSSDALRRVDGVGSGLFLMAFRVTPAERARLEGELAVRGSPIDGRTAFTSYARDPDGNRLAISHHPER